MINLQLVSENILDATADAILLTIDGVAKGMEGSIARLFAQRWPDVWNEVKEEIPYPLPYGTVFDYEPEDPTCPFKLVLIASLLPHRDVNVSNQKNFVRSSFHAAIQCALRDYQLATLVTPILKCGWRLSVQQAFLAMVEALDGDDIKSLRGTINISVIDSKEHEMLSSLANSLGFNSQRR